MKQNPFSLYDFLGYVFPGALVMMIIAFFSSITSLSSLGNVYESVSSLLSQTTQAGTLNLIEDTVILTILAYVIGHIVAYLSSITVESYSNLLFGYPSYYLLAKSEDTPKNLYWRFDKNRMESEFKWPDSFHQWLEMLWRFIVSLLLFPITLCYLILGKLAGMKQFFIKPLDETLRNAIKDAQEKLSNSLGIEFKKGDDFHRVVYHYEYEYRSHHITKLDNYVALYGFLRALTFIMTCTTLWISIKYIFPTIGIKGKEIDWDLLWMYVGCILLTYICFMGFMKFYRRFTLESFMCLVVDKSYKRD